MSNSHAASLSSVPIRRTAALLVAFVLLACDGSEPALEESACVPPVQRAPADWAFEPVGEWPIPPCEGESSDVCRVGWLEVDGTTRSYLVSLPATTTSVASGMPLVLVWHGSSGNGASQRDAMNRQFDDIAFDTTIGDAALIVYPDGIPHPDCFGNECWNRDPDGYDVHFFDALVDELAADWCIDTNRVASVGHSRGGGFVEVLGCNRAAEHAAIASFAAGTGNVDRCDGSVPVWLSHGRDDATIPFSQGLDHLEAWSMRNGCDALADPGGFPFDTCVDMTGCAEGHPVRWCPTTEQDWEGHGPPNVVDDDLWPFLSSTF